MGETASGYSSIMPAASPNVTPDAERDKKIECRNIVYQDLQARALSPGRDLRLDIIGCRRLFENPRIRDNRSELDEAVKRNRPRSSTPGELSHNPHRLLMKETFGTMSVHEDVRV